LEDIIISKTMRRTYVGTIQLGETAKNTVEQFIINQLGDDAKEDLEVDEITSDNIKKVRMYWEDGNIILDATFKKDGVWSSS